MNRHFVPLAGQIAALAVVLASVFAVPSAEASAAAAVVTADKIVVASDSRAWNQTTDAKECDCAKKVDVRHGWAFAMTSPKDGSPHLLGRTASA